MIKIPFKTQDLPQELREEFMELHRSEDWDGLAKFIEGYLDRVAEGRTKAEAVVLCLGYAKIMAAISIYVDDIVDSAKEIIKLIDSIESPSLNANASRSRSERLSTQPESEIMRWLG